MKLRGINKLEKEGDRRKDRIKLGEVKLRRREEER